MHKDEIATLRDEIAALRKRVAILEARPSPAGGVVIDWAQPFMVGTPAHKIVPMEALPPGTIVCTGGPR